jgi:hypothetical protein
MEGLRRYGGVIAGRVEKKKIEGEVKGSGENYRGSSIRSCCIAEPGWRKEWISYMRVIRGVVALTARQPTVTWNMTDG